MKVYDENIIYIFPSKSACCRSRTNARNAVILTYNAWFINRLKIYASFQAFDLWAFCPGTSFALFQFLFLKPDPAEHKGCHDQHNYDIYRRRYFINKFVRDEYKYEEYHPDYIQCTAVDHYTFPGFVLHRRRLLYFVVKRLYHVT